MFGTKTVIKALAVSSLLLSSCGMPKDIVYFENSLPNEVIELSESNKITARPNDELSIIVSCKDPELAAMFNLPIVSYGAGRTNMSYNQQVASYTVDARGNISFPVLGKVYVAGLKRDEIADKITKELKENEMVIDPVVVVDFINVSFSVTGEVTKPGRFSLDRDDLTIMDALAQAGDLTIFGSRPNVKVLRVVDGKQIIYEVDLTDINSVTSSPAYYVQQNDVIYVTPNKTRGRQSTVNGNNLISYSFWLSLASVLTSMAVLIFK